LPLAKEFRRGTGFPREDEVVDGFRVESVKVEHVGVSSGQYEYPIEILIERERRQGAGT